jgi:hypothetical protein
VALAAQAATAVVKLLRAERLAVGGIDVAHPVIGQIVAAQVVAV